MYKRQFSGKHSITNSVESYCPVYSTTLKLVTMEAGYRKRKFHFLLLTISLMVPQMGNFWTNICNYYCIWVAFRHTRHSQSSFVHCSTTLHCHGQKYTYNLFRHVLSLYFSFIFLSIFKTANLMYTKVEKHWPSHDQ